MWEMGPEPGSSASQQCSYCLALTASLANLTLRQVILKFLCGILIMVPGICFKMIWAITHKKETVLIFIYFEVIV